MTVGDPAGATATSRIGLGMATVMRAPSAADRQRILETAYEHGVRHFDTAPLYGLGRAEPDLGSFLRRSGVEDVTVATKFGLAPGQLGRLVAPIQAPVRAIVRSSPAVRRLIKKTEGAAAVPQQAPPSMIQDSVNRSCELMGLESIDLLLLHEVRWNNEWSQWWPEARSLSRVRSIGVSGTSGLLKSYPREVLADVAVLQGPADVAGVVSGASRIYHSVFAEFTPALAAAALGGGAATRRDLRRVADGPLTAKALRRLAVLALLAEDQRNMVLIGTANAAHVVEALADVDAQFDNLHASERAVLKVMAARARELLRPSIHGRL